MTPQPQPAPTLPPAITEPTGPPSATVEWWRALALYMQSRVMRAEIATGYAANVADAEREARETNATAQLGCALMLRSRDAEHAPPVAQ